MDAFLRLPVARRRLLFDEAAGRLGLAAASVEKEKVCLIHEENCRAAGAPPARLARHLSDLARLIEAGVAARALADAALFDRFVMHRRIFFKRGGDAQATLRRGSLRLVPSDARRAEWARDLDSMRAMFPEDPPAFDDILLVVGEFEREFNEVDS